ncbi:hypothetical protein DPEC_G00361250 [Dallia pectoralis]|uniref:Uncharacterized protein n=1 Tax=Dallia pectoralis TaxID=75939 RepID=A0ACC2F147_DALPE|nr:hypothetical protein DPEC_G00361250 [Dallia pectoralis]
MPCLHKRKRELFRAPGQLFGLTALVKTGHSAILGPAQASAVMPAPSSLPQQSLSRLWCVIVAATDASACPLGLLMAELSHTCESRASMGLAVYIDFNTFLGSDEPEPGAILKLEAHPIALLTVAYSVPHSVAA